MIQNNLEIFNNKSKYYTAEDTNLTSRQMHYLYQKGILLLRHHEYVTYKFSFDEILWLRLVTKLREFTVSFESIKKIKDELFKKTKLAEYLHEPNFDYYIDIALTHSDFTDMEKSEIRCDEKLIKKNLNLNINYFDIIMQQLVRSRNRVSLIIAIKNRGSGLQLERSDSDYWLTLFSPEKLENHSQQNDYFEIFSHDHISISLNDLLEDVFYSINYKKLPKNLVQLTDSEQYLFDCIRSGNYKSISVRFNDDKKPYLAELTEIKKLKAEARLYEIIHKGAYQEIEIKTQNGDVYSFKSTKKVKLA